MTGGWGWGLALGVGLALLWSWWEARIPRLEPRIAPHVRVRWSDAAQAIVPAMTPFPTVERLLSPVVREAAQWVDRWAPSQGDLRHRLDRAGTSITPDYFRAQQVLAGTLGLAVGTAASLALAGLRHTPLPTLLVLVGASVVAGVAARDYALSRAVLAREARISIELPTVAELLALAVGAGLGVPAALDRVARSTRGEVGGELERVLADVRAGGGLVDALGALGSRTGVEALRRFALALATAVERGTPVGEVLRAQAMDVRSAGQRTLIEEGGKKEIAMMVPVVFLILPVTVVFAVFPGIATIKVGL